MTFLGLSNDNTLMQIKSGRTVPLRPVLVKKGRPGHATREQSRLQETDKDIAL